MPVTDVEFDMLHIMTRISFLFLVPAFWMQVYILCFYFCLLFWRSNGDTELPFAQTLHLRFLGHKTADNRWTLLLLTLFFYLQSIRLLVAYLSPIHAPLMRSCQHLLHINSLSVWYFNLEFGFTMVIMALLPTFIICPMTLNAKHVVLPIYVVVDVVVTGIHRSLFFAVMSHHLKQDVGLVVKRHASHPTLLWFPIVLMANTGLRVLVKNLLPNIPQSQALDDICMQEVIGISIITIICWSFPLILPIVSRLQYAKHEPELQRLEQEEIEEKMREEKERMMQIENLAAQELEGKETRDAHVQEILAKAPQDLVIRVTDLEEKLKSCVIMMIEE